MLADREDVVELLLRRGTDLVLTATEALAELADAVIAAVGARDGARRP